MRRPGVSPVTMPFAQNGETSVPTSRTLTAGAGLTGGGDLSADRTFDVVANADGSVIVNANDVQVGVLATDAQHGVRGGGTQHANVVAAGAAGFMTGGDKTKLDGIATAAAAVTANAPLGVTSTGTPAVGTGTSAARDDHQHGIANASGSPQAGVCYWIGPITFTAGGGGAQDDTIYNANAPRKFRVLDMFVKVTTAVLNATLQLRDATGGAGNILASAVSGAGAALVRNNNTANLTIASGGTLVLRRADNTTAGIMFILVMPEA